jgi:hypothetical protein
LALVILLAVIVREEEGRLVDVVEDGDDAKNLEGIVDGPGDAVAKEEDEKDDADVFDNHVDDLNLALHCLLRDLVAGNEEEERYLSN